MQWYYSKGEIQIGPVSQDELRAKIAAGEVTSADLVWREGMAVWLPLASIPELADSSAPASPYAPPAGAYHSAMTPEHAQLPPHNCGLAIASLICGILGVLCIPVSLAAVICGHLAISEIAKSRGQLSGRGMAIAGLICGYLMIILTLFLMATGIFAGISTSH